MVILRLVSDKSEKTYELANLLKEIRGEQSLQDFSQDVDLGIQTILRLERGSTCKLSVLQKIIKRKKLNDDTFVMLLRAWLKTQLGKDFNKIIIESKDGIANDKPTGLAEIQTKISDLPKADQERILKLVERPPVLRMTDHLVETYDKIQSPRNRTR